MSSRVHPIGNVLQQVGNGSWRLVLRHTKNARFNTGAATIVDLNARVGTPPLLLAVLHEAFQWAHESNGAVIDIPSPAAPPYVFVDTLGQRYGMLPGGTHPNPPTCHVRTRRACCRYVGLSISSVAVLYRKCPKWSKIHTLLVLTKTPSPRTFNSF
jgi:hypothetical protein